MFSTTTNPTQATMDSYLTSRATLIAQEKSLRIDHSALQSLSSLESLAESKIRSIRASENISIWQKEEEKPSLFPGMHFLTSKSLIESTRLLKILKKMPKGGILQSHLDAMCDARFLLSMALEYPEMYISSPVTLPTGRNERFPIAPQSPLLSFKALPQTYSPTSTESIFSSSYIPNSPVPIAQARSSYPHGEEEFDNRIIGLLTIEPREAYGEWDTSNKIWKKFTSVFLVADGLIRYEPIFRRYVHQVFLTALEDGVSYLETRINFLSPTMIRSNGSDDLTHKEWIGIYKEEMEKVQKTHNGLNGTKKFWGAKIIYTTIRFIENEQLREAMEDCLLLKREYGDLIAGFDLVGHEDTLKTLKYYLPSLLWFKERQKEEGLDIPYIFHAGETLGDGDEIDHNLFDAILLDTKRIGHGFSLVKHPLLMDICRDRGMCIESCPVSSEILRYTPSVLNHPIQSLLNHGISVALSPDDPQIFGNLGLTYDFYQVILGSEATGLISLGVLAEKSILHSMMAPEEKAKRLAEWKVEWAEFVKWIVEEEGKA